MANWLKAKNSNQFKIYIPNYKTDNYYAEFEIRVQCQTTIEWRVFKRYSEFKKLYDNLLKLDSKYKAFFPPKKSFNNMSEPFLNSRRKSLEMYLNEIISMSNLFLPRCLAYFLEMDKYEIHGITTAMAKTLFTYGNSVLMNNNVFEISVLHIYSINQRMSSPVPTNLYQKQDEDFGNVLDILESLKKVKIVPYSSAQCSTDNCYGTSNIKVTSLTFDLSIFTSVTELQLDGLEISNLRGLYRMNNTIERLRANFSLKSIEDLLFADFVYKESSIDHLKKFDGPLRCATDVDLSHNSIFCIDQSIVTLRQVRSLTLAHNQISEVDHLHYLIYLSELDLSYNNLCTAQLHSLSAKLGSIKKLSLRGNKLTSLIIVDRMFSLEYLDVSDNLLSDNLSILSLCRLCCLESLIIKDNPIYSQADFVAIIYDLFLDRYQQVQINGYYYVDVPSNIRLDMDEYRASIKASLFSDYLIGKDNGKLSPGNSRRNKLSSINVHVDDYQSETIGPDSILGNATVFNIFVYWFFVATGRAINPKKLLWVTETFAPNRSVRPLPVLLVTSGTHVPNILKCRLYKWIDIATKRPMITIQPKDFVDLNEDFQHMIIGADKSFMKLDIAVNNRTLYLCNDQNMVDGFICHLYHVDDGMASYGDSRIVHLNEEDRMEMMRRFVDVWRLDMAGLIKRNCDNEDLTFETESEFLFVSRAMLEMSNGFQILLTVVVTKEILFLVDERIFDWPDFNRHPNLSDLSSGNSCSPYTSSRGQFPFLRTNAFLLGQIEVCSQMPISSEDNDFVDVLCPMFRYPVQITFTLSPQCHKDPLKLLFENDHKTGNLCRIIDRRCATIRPSPALSPDIVAPVSLRPSLSSDLPVHLRHLQSSYLETRLSLSLSCPRLLRLAQSSVEDIQSLYKDTVLHNRDATLIGLVWCKFIYVTFDNEQRMRASRRGESAALVCVCLDGISVQYEVDCEDEEPSCEGECPSDPEVDQPDNGGEEDGRRTKIESLVIDIKTIFKICVGLNHHWLTVCCRPDRDRSESDRLVLMVRNKDLCKHLISWINVAMKDQSDCSEISVDHGHQTSDIKELIYQIQKTCTLTMDSLDLVHYCSLDDFRFDPSQPCQSVHNNCDELFSYAIVVTTLNIAIVRHNIAEYPVRVFAPGTSRESPTHLQYQVLTVVPLFDLLQLQLPGHDRSVLIVVIRATDRHTSTAKFHLSISCQKEQKRLIERLRQQRSKCLQIDTPLRVSVC